MRIIFFVTIFLQFFFTLVNAQDKKFSFQTGLGFYDMSSLSKLTDEVKMSYSFDPQLVSDFPAYFYYKPMIKFSKKSTEYGFLFLYQTTGSRLSVKDYSAEYNFNITISSFSPGISINSKFLDYGYYSIWVGLQAGVNFSYLSINEYLQLNKEISEESYNFTSNSFFFQPEFNFFHPYKQWTFEFNVGFFKEIARKNYTLKGQQNSQIPVYTEYARNDMWDGLRTGLTISYSIQSKEN